MLGNGPPVVHARPTRPTRNGRLEVRCAGEERRWILFEEIRREYEFGLASISGVARKFGVHRRMVREAIESSIPMRLPVKERPRPTIGPVAGFIDEMLEADRQAPRKQRHTAHRIWVRLGKERSGYQIAESTVRQYVRQRKKTLGLRVVPEAFVPQQYAWGDEA